MICDHFFRDQIKGLRAQHQKEVANLKSLLDHTDSNMVPKEPKRVDENKDDLLIKPIGHVSTWHHTKNGTPRQGCIAKKAPGIIDLSEASVNHKGMENPQYALEGLEQFSHVWILFHFDQNNADGKSFIKTKVAPPRLKGQKIGLFSTRTPHRPNPIGLTLAKLDKIEGSKVYVEGLDLLDQTPILDIKPFIPQYDIPSKDFNPEEIKVPDWINDQEMNQIDVHFTPRALKQLPSMPLVNLKAHSDLKEAIIDVLKEDPRSNYRRDKCSDRLYYFTVDSVKVTCWFDDIDNNDIITEVLKLEEIKRS